MDILTSTVESYLNAPTEINHSGNMIITTATTTTSIITTNSSFAPSSSSSPHHQENASDSNNSNMLDEASIESIKSLQFIVWGILGSTLAVVGILGNLISMIVLKQRRMRSSTSYYLLSLAIYDNGVLLGFILYFSLPALAHRSSVVDGYMAVYLVSIPIGYSISLTMQMASIYTCVGFTIERFVAVCKPLHVANTCTKSRTLKIIFLIFVWSVAYNIPRFFHYHVTYGAPGSPPAVGENGEGMGSIMVMVNNNTYNATIDASWRGDIHGSENRGTGSGINISSIDYQQGLSSLIAELTTAASASSNLGKINSNSNSNNIISQVLEYYDDHQNGPAQNSSPSAQNVISSSLSSYSSSSPQLPSSSLPSSLLISLPSPIPNTTTSTTTTINIWSLIPTTAHVTPSSFSSTSSSSSSSSPASEVKRPMLIETEFGLDPTFQHVYLIYSYVSFMFLLPFVVILVLNIYLISAVKKSRSMRQSLTTANHKDQNLTVMLIAVIVVFLVCQFSTMVDNILLAIFGEQKLKALYSYQVFFTICAFMVEINAAINFVLYCFFGKKFRLVLLSLFGCNKSRRKHVAYRSTSCKSMTRINGTRTYGTEMSAV